MDLLHLDGSKERHYYHRRYEDLHGGPTTMMTFPETVLTYGTWGPFSGKHSMLSVMSEMVSFGHKEIVNERVNRGDGLLACQDI